MREPITVGLLGYGTVGQAVAGALSREREAIARAVGRPVEVGPVLVREPDRQRAGVTREQLTGDPATVLDDPRVSVVVEVMGGVDPTLDILRAALTAGTPVVTANKQLLAQHGPELFRIAAEAGAQLRFEGSVCAAIPVIKVLRESLVAADVWAVTGIVNGTTNLMLSAMRHDGLSYDEALARAQRLGYAEADPTEDVGGADAAAKMAILASIAFHSPVRLGDVPYEGIDGLHSEDVEIAADLGYEVKLLGVARRGPEGIGVRVYPALVAASHPLAAIRGADNAVMLESVGAGRITLVGPGAGGVATASAVIADVLSVLAGPGGSFLHNAPADAGWPVMADSVVPSAYYVRLSVADRPGVLAHIASRVADHGLSFRTVEQRGAGDQARLVAILHRGDEAAMAATLDSLSRLPEVRARPVLLRVIENGDER